jgi:hypothetical protein
VRREKERTGALIAVYSLTSREAIFWRFSMTAMHPMGCASQTRPASPASTHRCESLANRLKRSHVALQDVLHSTFPRELHLGHCWSNLRPSGASCQAVHRDGLLPINATLAARLRPEVEWARSLVALLHVRVCSVL